MKFSNNINKLTTLAILSAFGGCTPITPRPFLPLTQPPEAASQAEFETAFQSCVAEVTNGTGYVAYSRKAETVAGAVGAVGGAAGVAGGVAMVSSFGGLFGAAGSAAAVSAIPAAVVLAPVVGGYGWARGVAVINRNVKESKVQKELTSCMAKSDFNIVSWRKLTPEDDTKLATPVAAPKVKK